MFRNFLRAHETFTPSDVDRPILNQRDIRAALAHAKSEVLQ